MPQNVGDLLERRSLLQKPARDAVPEGVDTRPRPTTSAVGLLYGPLHDTHPDRLVVGCDVADEHGPVGRLWPLRAQVLGDRAAGLRRQRKDIGPAGLALGQTQGPRTPVYVVEAQVDDLAGAQPEVGKAARTKA